MLLRSSCCLQTWSYKRHNTVDQNNKDPDPWPQGVHRLGCSHRATRKFYIHVLRVTRHTSHVTRHTSHDTRHTSCAAPGRSSVTLHTYHTSNVTRHTSHVTRHALHRDGHPSRFTRIASLVTRHTSLVTRFAVHYARHKSHFTRHASQVTHTSHTRRTHVAHTIQSQTQPYHLPLNSGYRKPPSFRLRSFRP